MNRIQVLLNEYSESHRNIINKRIHWICVPLIYFSVFALLWSIPSNFFENLFKIPHEYMNWANFIAILVFIYYIILSPKLTLGMLLFTSFCFFTCNEIYKADPNYLWKVALIIFVLAWIGQFIGHHIEGKKPSFFKDLQFLLIGPLWLLSFIYQKLNLRY